MRKYSGGRKILVPIVLMLCMSWLSDDANATDPPAVCIIPDSLVVAVNETFALNIFITDGITDLMGYNIAVAYDSSVIKLQSVDEGPLPLGSGYDTFFYWLNPPPSDLVHVNGAILGHTVDGPGVLFTLTFKGAPVEVLETTDVVISFSLLRTGINEDIVHSVKPGHVVVVPPIPTEPTTWGEVKSLYSR